MLQVSGRNYLRVCLVCIGLLFGQRSVSNPDEHILIWTRVELNAMTWSY